MSPFDSVPLLIGEDVLNRFEPLIDFKRLKICAQVHRPLPIDSPQIIEAQYYKLESNILTADALSGQPQLADVNRVPDTDKETLAKQGILDRSLWQFNLESPPGPPTPMVDVVSRAQAKAPPDNPQNTAAILVAPSNTDSDFKALQALDLAIRLTFLSLSDASNNVILSAELNSISGLRHLYNAHPSLPIVKGLLVHVSDALTGVSHVTRPPWPCPHMLVHTHTYMHRHACTQVRTLMHTRAHTHNSTFLADSKQICTPIQA